MAETVADPPFWLDRDAYPFAPHFLDVSGGQMHYVDEGVGSPVLLVHGTPTWSFLYRNVIRRLSGSHRVIAPDLIGFGLSGKPTDWSYTLADHASNLRRLVTELNLHDITLVVHDVGGPIGLAVLFEHLERFRRVVITNTFLWRLTDPHFTRPARLLGSRIGRLAYTRLNVSARFFMPRVFGDRKLSDDAHMQYRSALARGGRVGPWAMARELRRAGDWLEQQWQRAEMMKSMPVPIVWGEKDPTFRSRELVRWIERFPEARVARLPDVGHFIAEEVPDRLADEIEDFIAAT
ncbi:MAG: alpha/beta fold hydrolase [Chloroflexi bacterium]|nr:alpha/beta fold hydrolase [Chloroflexota bacterium]